MKPGDVVIPFGSYRGKSLSYIYKTDPQYLLWCRDNLNGWILKAVEDYIKEKNREIILRGRE